MLSLEPGEPFVRIIVVLLELLDHILTDVRVVLLDSLSSEEGGREAGRERLALSFSTSLSVPRRLVRVLESKLAAQIELLKGEMERTLEADPREACWRSLLDHEGAAERKR